MVVLKVIQHTNAESNYLAHAIHYIINKEEMVFYDGFCVNPDIACWQMLKVKQYFGKMSGNPLMHLIVSFDTQVNCLQDAVVYAYEIAKYYGNRFQIVYSIHEKAQERNGRVLSFYHVHYIINSVSYIDGRMFAQNKGEIHAFGQYVSQVVGGSHFRVIYGREERDENQYKR